MREIKPISLTLSEKDLDIIEAQENIKQQIYEAFGISEKTMKDLPITYGKSQLEAYIKQLNHERNKI